MPLSEQQEREEAQKSALNAQRYRKQTLQQAVRGNIVKENQEAEQSDNVPQESAHKSRLAMLKAGAMKQANSQAGGAVGASVGGTLGSVIPVVGTGIGIFLGRFIGKKAGITGIIIFALLSLLFLLVIFIAILKGMCETYPGMAANALVKAGSLGSTDICAALK